MVKTVTVQFGAEKISAELPDSTEVLTMTQSKPLPNPAEAVRDALVHSIGSPGLDQIIRNKLQDNPNAKAVVVISDNSRPVPYLGEAGILWPVLEKLLAAGFTKERILILVATGTHRPLTDQELHEMIDPRVFGAAIPIINHDCRDQASLVFLGETFRKSKIYINRRYLEADLKILTGLVESHFMAGVSGGRKSVCPGLIGEASTYVFHGAPMLASDKVCDLNLDGNPCHEEALEVASKAGVDYIVNVTLDHQFRVTGVFAGHLEAAHLSAVERLTEYSRIGIRQEYDIVATHAGFVGINHYQAAKAGVVAIPALKTNGKLIMIADNTDSDPIGSPRYHSLIHLLKLFGPQKFNQLLLSPDWGFIPDQWQVQMWARLFTKIPMENFIYYSSQLNAGDYQFLPGRDGNEFLSMEERYRGVPATAAKVMGSAVRAAVEELHSNGQKEVRIVFLADGPYGIIIKN